MVPRNDAPAVFSEKGDRRPAFENFGGIARPSRLALPEGRAGADRGPSPSIFLVPTPNLNPAECWDLMNRRTQPCWLEVARSSGHRTDDVGFKKQVGSEEPGLGVY